MNLYWTSFSLHVWILSTNTSSGSIPDIGENSKRLPRKQPNITPSTLWFDNVYETWVVCMQIIIGGGITLPMADSRYAPSQWETALLCNDVSHWLGASLESALLLHHMVCTSLKTERYKVGIESTTSFTCVSINTLRLRRNGRHFVDGIFKCILLNENVWISHGTNFTREPSSWLCRIRAFLFSIWKDFSYIRYVKNR